MKLIKIILIMLVINLLFLNIENLLTRDDYYILVIVLSDIIIFNYLNSKLKKGDEKWKVSKYI